MSKATYEAAVAFEAGRDDGITQGRADAEREIVAWLRAEHGRIRAMQSNVRNLDEVADVIERGDYRGKVDGTD